MKINHSVGVVQHFISLFLILSELLEKSFSEKSFLMKEEESEFKKIKVLIAEDDEASFILMSKVIGTIQ